MALFSAIDATERTLGPRELHGPRVGGFRWWTATAEAGQHLVRGFQRPAAGRHGNLGPARYDADLGIRWLRIKGIAIEIDATEKKRVLQIDQEHRRAAKLRPGETIELMVTLAGENGAEVQKTARYKVPEGAPAGTLQITVADASSSNMLDLQQLAIGAAKSPSQLIGFLNGLRPNTKAYARIWRSDPAYQVQGQDLPDPPPSVAADPGQGARHSTNLEFDSARFESGGVHAGREHYVVAGSKTVQVEVRE